MKKFLVLAILITASLSFKTEAKTFYPGDYGYFYSNLAPHGTWIEFDYGVVAWRPTIIRRNWSPYRYGYWIWTVDGWYWESYEPFGYITYHYGRWHYDDYYGWIWLPDNEWAPAWVEWRYDDHYIGWAPLSPYATFSINIGIHFTHNYYVPYHHWQFVKYKYICDPYVYNHYVPVKHKYRIYNRTKYRTNYGYYDGRIVNRGVDVDYIRKRSGQNIRTRDIYRYHDEDEYNRYKRRNVGMDDYDDDSPVRSFIVSKDRSYNNDRNFEIKRSERKSSLEISKLQIGRDRERVERSRELKNDKNYDRIITDRDRNSENNRNESIYKNNRRYNGNDVEKEKRVEEQRNNPFENNDRRDVNRNRSYDRDVKKESGNENRSFEKNKRDYKNESNRSFEKENSRSIDRNRTYERERKKTEQPGFNKPNVQNDERQVRKERRNDEQRNERRVERESRSNDRREESSRDRKRR